MGVDQLRLKKEEILFVPYAGWDVAGAKWFGYKTFCVNRSSGPMEKLDAKPDGIGNNLTDLVEFVRKYNNHT
jgi:2-haloacid dehalogenase